MRLQLAECAYRLLNAAQYQEALEVFDTLLEHDDLPLAHYCNALWAAQTDNTKLPHDVARSRRYLAAALPHAARNPTIHLNAAGLLAELGDTEAAIEQLEQAAKAGVDLRPFLEEPLLIPLRNHPKWSSIASPDAPGTATLELPAPRPVPSWAGFFTPDEYGRFYELTLERLDAAGHRVDESHFDDCGVLRYEGGGSMGLVNLARLCRKANAEHWSALIDEHLRVLTPVSGGLPVEFRHARHHLKVRIVPERQVAARPTAYVSRDLVGGLRLVLALDTPHQVVFVHPRDVDRWGQDEASLFLLAERATHADEPLETFDVVAAGDARVVALMGDSPFAASHVLFLERYVPAPPAGYLVSVPDRHAILALPLTGLSALAGLGALLELGQERFATQPGPLSDELFWRRPDGQLVRVTCGLRDEGEPWIAAPSELDDLLREPS